MIDTGMTPERAQAIARDVLAEITGRRSGDGDSAAAAEQVLTERFPDLTEYDRTAVLFRVNRMLSARATRVARGGGAGGGRGMPVPADLPQGDSMVGDAIANRRQARGLSLDDLAAQVGVAPARMRNFELGHRRVPVAILARIAQVLHVDLGWFSGEGAAQAANAAADEAEAVMGSATGDAAASPASAPEGGADDRRSPDLDRDELFDLYTQLTPAMRRLVAGIMREMVADRSRSRRADEDADAALRQSA